MRKDTSSPHPDLSTAVCRIEEIKKLNGYTGYRLNTGRSTEGPLYIAALTKENGEVDFFNYHPARLDFQLVKTLLNPEVEKVMAESEQSLQRLYG